MSAQFEEDFAELKRAYADDELLAEHSKQDYLSEAGT
jgi:hypothetical protein